MWGILGDMFGRNPERGIFGKRSAPEVNSSTSQSTEVAAYGKINTPEGLIALAEKWSDKPDMADNLRQLASLLSIQGTAERVRDDAIIIDNLFKLVNSQLRNVGDSIRREDF